MKCTQCAGRAQLALCKTCIDHLETMLADLAWLLYQLEVTAARQDRLTVGALPAGVTHPSPVNLGAVELQRSIATRLRKLVGFSVPGGSQGIVAWMQYNVVELAKCGDAGKYYRTVQDLVGTSGYGPIHDVINRVDRRFVGDCPECGALCYARGVDVYTTCPVCGIPIDVDKNQTRALVEYDLLPERALLATLDNLGEHVPRVKFYNWVTAGKILVAGYLSPAGVVAHKNGRHGPRVYSLTRIRALRRREQQTSQPILASR